MSRLYQHLKVVSTGGKVDLDLEAMQRVQNAAMMWIGGEGKRVFRITKSEERLGWLNMGQLAAKATIMAALKIIWEGEGLGRAGTDKLVKTDKHGMQRVKTVGE